MLCISATVAPISYAARPNNSASIVIEATTCRVLSEINAHCKLPMASTTKIMTALVVLENANIDEIVTVPQEAVGMEGSSIYLKKGEKLTVKDLLYGLMLRSGNDAAVALAIYVGGSVDEFVKMMNEKAAFLGAENTNFVNPHGLHHKNHYTTAYDLAIITACAMKNQNFCQIVATKAVTVGDNENESLRYLVNKNKILSLYEGGNGVKTGYTTDSGRCLVSASKRNGMQIICVVLNHYSMWEDSMQFMTQAYADYTMTEVLKNNYSVDGIDVIAGTECVTSAQTVEGAFYPLKKGEYQKVSYDEKITKHLVAPVSVGTECGCVDVYLDNRLLFSKKIYTIENIARKSIFDWSYWQLYEN